VKQFMTYLETMEEKLHEESARLAADDRQDESAMAKIRANVYGICKSVFHVLDTDKAVAKLTELYDDWESALRLAREHENTKKVIVEQIKLEVLDDVIKKRNDLIGV